MAGKKRAKGAAFNQPEVELRNVEEASIPIESILLDSNNPRFVTGDGPPVKDEAIADERSQEAILKKLREIGIDDVKDKIAAHGYQLHERIFVRPAKCPGPAKYVVLEGNRRVASVKTLLQQEERGEINLTPAVMDSLASIPAVIYKGADPKISWMVQGLRHITAIKNWEPIQQARFIHTVARETGDGPIEVGKRFGLSGRDAAKLVDAFHLFNQAKQDKEHGEQLQDSKFAVFHEGVFDKRAPLAQDFLGYSEKTHKATKLANLTRLLALVVPADDKTPALIKRAIDVRDKLPLITDSAETLDKIISGDLTFEDAVAESRAKSKEKEEKKLDLGLEFAKLEEAMEAIAKLPITAVAVDPAWSKNFLASLGKLEAYVSQHLKILRK